VAGDTPVLTPWVVVMPEPPETYHTSAHLLSDLGIDEGLTGSLPSAERTRAGLAAEQLEDVEGKRAPRRTRARPGRTRRAPAEVASSEVAEVTGAEPRRQRRRRRVLDPSESPAPEVAVGPERAVVSDPDADAPARTRRRRRGSRGRGGAAAPEAPDA